MAKRKYFTTRLLPDWIKKVKAYAKTHGLSVYEVIEQALTRFLL